MDANTSRPSRPPGRALYLLLPLLVFTAALGVVGVFEFRSSPFFRVPVIDEESYLAWALAIRDGRGASQGVFYQDPLYPYFLALVFSVFGENFFAARIIQVLMAVGVVGLVFWAGRKLSGERTGFLAGLLAALYSGLYFNALLLIKAETVMFLSALSLALGVLAADRRGSKWPWLGLGVSLGLLSLLRGNFLPMFPFLLAWALLFPRKENFALRLRPAVLLAAGLGIVILPVTVRNYLLSGDLVLTTSQGGANFYIGNNEKATGRFQEPDFVRAHPSFEAADFQREAERRSGQRLTPGQVSRFWFREGRRWIAAHPGAAFRLTLHKTRLLLNQYETPDTHSLYLIRSEFVPALGLAFVGLGWLWGPGLLGLGILLRRDPRAAYPALFIVLYAGGLIPFFIVSRYRVAVVPGLCLFAAFFLTWAWEKVKRREMQALLLAGLPLAVLLWLGLAPIEESRSTQAQEYYLLAEAYLADNSPAEALAWYDRALDDHPDYRFAQEGWAEAVSRLDRKNLSLLMAESEKKGRSADQLVMLGHRLRDLDEPESAVAVYERAAALDPNRCEVHAFLGWAYAGLPAIKNLDAAIRHYELALVWRPAELEIMNQLAKCYASYGEEEKAENLYLQVLRLDPHNPEALMALKPMFEFK